MAIDAQIAELKQIHKGLIETTADKDEIILAGPLPFEASADGCGSITENFEIELAIAAAYPKFLPRVREIGGRIESTYDHVYQDGTLCLAVPIEERRLFLEQPTLLGFVNRLVIPYIFGYSYWKIHGRHPFDEHDHGAEGIMRHYRDSLHLESDISVLAVLSYLIEYGYRGHHPCPCSSREKVRKCHGKALRDLHEQHTSITLRNDFVAALNHCLSKAKAGEFQLPEILKKQVIRIFDKSIIQLRE